LTDHMGIDVDNRQVLISGGKYQLKVVTKVGAANYTRTMLDNYEVLSECQTNVGCDKVDSLMSNTIAYNPVFSPGAVVDGATYMVCPGTTMYAKDLSEYTFLSEDGVIWSQLPYLIGWTYLAGVKKNISYNGMGVDPTVNRTDVIGSSSRTVGTRVYPVTTGLISRSGGISSPYTKNEMTIYTFDEKGNHTVFVDLIHAYCYGSQRYICPYLGTSWRSTLCQNLDINTRREAEGWVPQKNYSVSIAEASVSVNRSVESITLGAGESRTVIWVINNTANNKVSIKISRECGNLTCNFIGYTENSSVSIDSKGSASSTYTVTMNISLTSNVSENDVGIRVIYDDNYGLACIAPAVESNLLKVYGIYSKKVNLKYRVSDDWSTELNCSLWTNMTGSWKENRTYDHVPNGSVIELSIDPVPAGYWRWGVICTDSSGQSEWANNSKPVGYWEFTV